MRGHVFIFLVVIYHQQGADEGAGEDGYLLHEQVGLRRWYIFLLSSRAAGHTKGLRESKTGIDDTECTYLILFASTTAGG